VQQTAQRTASSRFGFGILRPAANAPSHSFANVLVRVPGISQGFIKHQTDRQGGRGANHSTHFLKLESPNFSHLRPRIWRLASRLSQFPNAPAGKWNWIGAIIAYRRRRHRPLCWLTKKEVRIGKRELSVSRPVHQPFQPGPEGIAGPRFSITIFKTDLVLAGAGGVRLLKQESPNKIHRRHCQQTKLPATILTCELYWRMGR